MGDDDFSHNNDDMPSLYNHKLQFKRLERRWKHIPHPTDFIYKWSSTTYLTERRGEPIREISYDMNGKGLYEFKDGTRVVCSQNCARWLSDEIRDKYIGKRHRTWDSNHSKPFLTDKAKEILKKRRKIMEEIIKEAGGGQLPKDGRLSTIAPHQVIAATKFAASNARMTVSAWVLEAVIEKLERDIVGPNKKISIRKPATTVV